MAAADGHDSRADEQYIQMGKWAGKGNLEAIMGSIGEADENSVAHAVRCASQHSHIHVLKALLPRIIGINKADLAGQSGFTALHFAIYGDASPETIQELIDAGACPYRIPSTKKPKDQVNAFEQLSKRNIEQSTKEYIGKIMSAHRCIASCREAAQGVLTHSPSAIVDSDMTSTPIIPWVDSQGYQELAGVWAEPTGDDEGHVNYNKMPRLG
jgi:hypothetical protein